MLLSLFWCTVVHRFPVNVDTPTRKKNINTWYLEIEVGVFNIGEAGDGAHSI